MSNLVEVSQYINSRTYEFIEKLKETYDIKEDELNKIIKNINMNITKKKKVIATNEIKCCAVMKTGSRKGQQCLGKVKEGSYCNRHSKLEGSSLENSQEPKLDYEYTARLNRFNRYEFGKTGLIFKSQNEIYVIGKQLDDGNIIKLSDEDKELCKKYKLKYIKDK